MSEITKPTLKRKYPHIKILLIVVGGGISIIVVIVFFTKLLFPMGINPGYADWWGELTGNCQTVFKRTGYCPNNACNLSFDCSHQQSNLGTYPAYEDECPLACNPKP
jgi:hypothetical protein